MSLKIRIRELRKAKGWTLDEMASYVGISTPHLSEVERGVKNLNNHLIERISKALDVSHHELFVDAGQLAEVSSTYGQLSPERQHQLLEFARFLQAQQGTSSSSEERDDGRR